MTARSLLRMLPRRRRRTPTVIQMEAVECGAASLAIILGYYGRWVPLEELRYQCGVSRDGAKATAILGAATKYGLKGRGLRFENFEEAFAINRPFVVFWNFNHFLVAEKLGRTHVRINDPATGPRRISREEFRSAFTGVVLDMQPGPDFKPGGERHNIVRALASRLRGSRTVFSFLLMVSLLLVVPGLLMPAFVKAFINDILIKGNDSWLLPLLIGMALASVLNGILTYLQQRYLLKIQVKLGVTAASQFFWRVLRVPVDFYTQRYVGDIATRVQSCNRIATLLSGPLPTNLINALMVVFYGGVMLLYSVPLALAAMTLTGVNVLAVAMVSRKRKELNNNLINQQSKMVGVSMAGLQAMETLKATGTEGDFYRIWSGYQTNNLNLTQDLGVVSGMLASVPSTIGTLSNALVLGLGGYLIIRGHLTIGGLIAFQMLMGNFSAPVQSLVAFGGKLQEIEADLNRLDDVLRQGEDPLLDAEDIDRDGDGGDLLSGALDFVDVSYGYNPLAPPLIENFNISIKPGQRVALVGPSGSGKSTVAKLILGLAQPTGGEIRFDGMPLRSIPRSVFTASVSYVAQDSHIFSGTIFDNLTLWDPTIPRDQAVRAAKDSCIHNDIAARTGGYDSDLAEAGANFSGGQRQRLEIARALASNPRILVLDEATSALDPLTESTIDSNIRQRGCTAIIVAHRLSTIRDSDEIIVLDRGQIVERGNHEHLMGLNGMYAKLVGIQ